MKLMMKLRHKMSCVHSKVESGMTLIELIMTIVVVGIIAIPLSLLMYQHVTSVALSEDYTMAINLGRFEIETVKSLDYTNIVNDSSTYLGYNVNRTVTYAYGNGSSAESLKEIKVDVIKVGTTTVLVSFVTYVARNVSYGV